MKKKPKTFFDLHWNHSAFSIDTPDSAWKKYNLTGEIPDNYKQGCYAFLHGDEVVYIGLGASRGNGRYKEFGIGSRLNQHMYWDKSKPYTNFQDRVYRVHEKWGDVSSICTFGLPSGYGISHVH